MSTKTKEQLMPRLPQEISPLGEDAVLAVAIVEEIARVEGWDNLDQCLQQGGVALIDTYMAYADAALLAIKRADYRPALH